jgi:hypothetical protein
LTDPDDSDDSAEDLGSLADENEDDRGGLGDDDVDGDGGHLVVGRSTKEGFLWCEDNRLEVFLNEPLLLILFSSFFHETMLKNIVIVAN